MESRSEGLFAVLPDGPARTSIAISKLIEGHELADTQVTLTPAWLIDVFRSELTELERECVRDAIGILLLKHWDVDSDSCRLFLASVLNIAAEIGLLRLRGERLESQLWASTYERAKQGRIEEAALVAAHLATHGRQRSAVHWTGVLSTLGEQGAMACALGVQRSGAFECLHWLFENLSGEHQTQVLRGLLPTLVNDDSEGVAEFLSSGRHGTSSRSRTLVIETLVRYELPVPKGTWAAVAANIDRKTPAEYGSQIFIGYARYEVIDSSNASPSDALDEWIAATEYFGAAGAGDILEAL